MHWAKTQQRSRYTLATSGIQHFPFQRLPVKLDELAISGPSYYGYPPLQEALAKKNCVDQNCVVAATGTSMANFLAMAAVVSPGDVVLIESPTYELLCDAAGFLQANIRRFPRHFESAFALDLEEVERAITPQTKLVVVTNLHNPSSNFTSNETLRSLGDIARSVGARVLVDEVYLDALFEKTPRSAVHLGREFIVTSSLTKVYGLSGLRCGWILAEPDLAQRIFRMNDLFGSIPAHPAELLSVIALHHLPEIADWSKNLLTTQGAMLNEFLAAAPRIRNRPLAAGTIIFPKTDFDVEVFSKYLREEYETTIVPGHFFGAPSHFRLGIGNDTEMFREGLRRLNLALESFPG
jgi:aspartate/methionine/tyrosine aminotransferase